MRIWRAFIGYLIEVEETTGRDSFFAEGLETIEGRGGEKPC